MPYFVDISRYTDKEEQMDVSAKHQKSVWIGIGTNVQNIRKR